MSDSPLAPGIYRIQNTWWQSQFVYSERLSSGIVTGNHLTQSGIQTWLINYEDGFVTFQGWTPTTQITGFICVDEAGKGLVYVVGDKRTKFRLQIVDSLRPDVFVVIPTKEDGSDSYPVGWQLPSGDDGTQVRVSNVLIEGGEWKFIEQKPEGSD